LVPIVEDGLFGYELMPDRETHIYPIIGCNAQGEPRKNLRRRRPHAMHLQHGRAFRAGAQRAVVLNGGQFVSQLACCRESAWEQLLILVRGRLTRPILGENAPRLDKALLSPTASVPLGPIHRVYRLPNEAQFGFMLWYDMKAVLTFQQPDTWTRLECTPRPSLSWSPMERLNHRAEDYRGFPDRRAECRRAKKCGGSRTPGGKRSAQTADDAR
jgi:hypothetical protein